MGVRWLYFILLCVFCVSFLHVSSAATAQRGITACDIQGCNCTVKAASWKVINCSLHENKVKTLWEINILYRCRPHNFVLDEENNYFRKSLSIILYKIK